MILKFVFLALVAGAAGAVICCMGSSQVSRIEEAEFPCYGCFWENHCNHENELKLCTDGHNGWEDAPWEKV